MIKKIIVEESEVKKAIQELQKTPNNNKVVWLIENQVGFGITTNIYVDGKHIEYEEITESLDDYYFATITSDIYLIIKEDVILVNRTIMLDYSSSDKVHIDMFRGVEMYQDTFIAKNDNALSERITDKYVDDIFSVINKRNEIKIRKERGKRNEQFK